MTLVFIAVAMMWMSSVGCHKNGLGAVVPNPFLRDVAPFPVGVSVGCRELHDWPLRFDQNYRRKKTYSAFADELRN